MAGFGSPEVRVAFSVFENKGVFALLLGSGLSRSADIPTGWEITLDLVRRVALAQGVTAQTDWAQWYRDNTGGKEPDYSDLLAQLATTPTLRRSILHSYIEPTEEDRAEGRKIPTAAHKAVAELVRDGFIKVIITTNFDRLMENALHEIGIEPTVIASEDALKGAEPLAHAACYIFKLHGDYMDARILNTEEELKGYPAAYNTLLDRIFDEYGLIVCGWSGEWDHALRAAITRAPNRRYPLFWATRGEVKGKAKELCDQRKGVPVAIEDADKFFTGIREQVRTLGETQRRNPAEIALLMGRAKRYLSKPEYRIQLSDLIQGEVQKIIDRLAEPDMAPTEPSGQITPENFRRRVDTYESIGEGLVKICGLIGVWGDAADLRLATGAIETLWTVLQPTEGGVGLYLDMRGYIPVLAAQACSLGFIKAARWREYREFLRQELPADRGQERTFLTELNTVRWQGNERSLWNLLFPQRNHHAPLADHLHDYFESASRDFLGIVPDFTALYLMSEALSAIAWVDAHTAKEFAGEFAVTGQQGRGYFWAPVFGRMGWDGWPASRLFDRLETERFASDLAAGGFGGGNVDVVKAATANMRRLLEHVHW